MSECMQKSIALIPKKSLPVVAVLAPLPLCSLAMLKKLSKMKVTVAILATLPTLMELSLSQDHSKNKSTANRLTLCPQVALLTMELTKLLTLALSTASHLSS